MLRNDVHEWFEINDDSPYMLLVADVATGRRNEMTMDADKLFGIDRLNVPRSQIPAVTHVDYSARVQTVHRETNARFHDLLIAFKKRNAVSRHRKYELQRPGRALGLHARRRVSLLYGNGDRISCGWRLFLAQK